MLPVDFPFPPNYIFNSNITRFKKSLTYPMLWLRRYNSFYVYNILPKVSVISKICSVSGRIYSMIYLIKLWDVSYCILLQKQILPCIQTFEINSVTKFPFRHGRIIQWRVLWSSYKHVYTVTSAYKEPAYMKIPAIRNWSIFPNIFPSFLYVMFIRNSG